MYAVKLHLSFNRIRASANLFIFVFLSTNSLALTNSSPDALQFDCEPAFVSSKFAYAPGFVYKLRNLLKQPRRAINSAEYVEFSLLLFVLNRLAFEAFDEIAKGSGSYRELATSKSALMQDVGVSVGVDRQLAITV